MCDNQSSEASSLLRGRLLLSPPLTRKRTKIPFQQYSEMLSTSSSWDLFPSCWQVHGFAESVGENKKDLTVYYHQVNQSDKERYDAILSE